MRVLVDIGHPAHVHFYKNFIWEMESRGHQIIVTARDKDVAISLLQGYNIPYTTVGKLGNGKLTLIKEWIGRDWEIYKIARNFRPDILTGIHNPCVAHVARLTGAKSIIFTDTEHATIANMTTFPFADTICTPSCFKKDLGKKHIKYNGYHELAYLHPKYFKPDLAVLSELGIRENDKYIIMRFVSWGASHDIGQSGFDISAIRRLISEFEKKGSVFITSESSLSSEFERYRIRVKPEKLHYVLYFASLVIGDGATTATEAAVLGTPSIYVSTTARFYGNYDDLSDNYGLVYTYPYHQEALEKAGEILSNQNSKEDWKGKREKMLADKIDVTQFMIDYVENYYASNNLLKETFSKV